MSRSEAIHIDFHLTEEQERNEFRYEQVYFFLKENGWVLDLKEPIMFVEPGVTGFADRDLDEAEISVENEAELIARIREKERLNEPMGLGFFDDGELVFKYELKNIEFGELSFWFLVNGELVGQEVCIIFEQLARKIVKPFCDTFLVERIDLSHG